LPKLHEKEPGMDARLQIKKHKDVPEPTKSCAEPENNLIQTAGKNSQTFNKRRINELHLSLNLRQSRRLSDRGGEEHEGRRARSPSPLVIMPDPHRVEFLP
jgi:hypothetical protein